MAWFTRLTRFGDVHLVYGQEAGMSCGIASVMMCAFKLNKLTPGATAVTIEKDIYQKYSTVMGSTSRISASSFCERPGCLSRRYSTIHCARVRP